MNKIKLYIAFFFIGNLMCQSQIDYSKFKGYKVKTAMKQKLNSVFFKEYGNDFLKKYKEIIIKNEQLSNDTPENVLTLLYSVSSKEKYKNLFLSKPFKIKKRELEERKMIDTLPQKLRLIQRLTFNKANKKISFLKYLKYTDSITYETNLLSLVKIKGEWKIKKDDNFENVAYVIKVLKPLAFWEFFNRQNNKKYPEINKLKPIVQNRNGILDIEKLAQVLKDNKASLAKYLDE